MTVNGNPVGESPLASSVFLEPGTYAFDASLGQDRKASKQMQLQKGGTYDVSLTLSQPRVAPVSGFDSTPRSKSSPNYLPAGVSAAVGGVAVITGVVFLVAASSKDNRREDLRSSLAGANNCSGSDVPPACTEISRLAWDASHFRTGALVSFGAALGAGILTYILWPRSIEKQKAGMVVSPSYSHEARSFDLSAVGRF